MINKVNELRNEIVEGYRNNDINLLNKIVSEVIGINIDLEYINKLNKYKYYIPSVIQLYISYCWYNNSYDYKCVYLVIYKDKKEYEYVIPYNKGLEIKEYIRIR